MSDSTPTAIAWPADRYSLVEGWSAVLAEGSDAGKFLQGFCTNDVLALAVGDACEAMFTDVKAHVIAYAWVSRLGEEHYAAVLSSDRAPRLLEHLDRYLIRERVALETLGPSTAVVATADQLAATELVLAPAPSLGGDACVGVGLTEAVNAAVADLRSAGSAPMEAEEFALWRIRLGAPFDGVDVDERNLPQELDRDASAISFKKGCYLGQEPVARIDALGRVNWVLRGLAIESSMPPSAGVEGTVDGKKAARVTSVTRDGDGSLALAYVRREARVEGTQVDFDGVAATVRELPIR